MEAKKRIHIIGTHGVPAKYGGFETLADKLCLFLGNDYDLTVYCNAAIYPQKKSFYHGARLVYVPIGASGFSGIFYDLITYIRALRESDVILYLSPVGSGFMTPLNIFKRKKVIINHGGLNEWEREKLNFLKRKWARFNHRIAAKFADINIADNHIYRKSLKDNFNADSIVIKYGGDHVSIPAETEKMKAKYPFVGTKYAVSVSRAQVDNNLHLALEVFETFSKFKLVLVSNWEVSAYGKELKVKYRDNKNIILLDAIYNQEELNYVRGNAYCYIHTHSRCGTAPSLVEAMSLKLPVISFDVPTNRETTNNEAVYFGDAGELSKILNSVNPDNLNQIKSKMYSLAEKNFQWRTISNEYSKLFDD